MLNPSSCVVHFSYFEFLVKNSGFATVTCTSKAKKQGAKDLPDCLASSIFSNLLITCVLLFHSFSFFPYHVNITLSWSSIFLNNSYHSPLSPSLWNPLKINAE